LSGHQPSIDVQKHALAQAGAGGDHRDVSARDASAFLQHGELVAGEYRNRVGHRLEIVEQPDLPEAVALHQRRGVDSPGNVGELGDLIGDGAGHPERCGFELAGADPALAQKRPKHRVQPVVIERDELVDVERPGPRLPRVEQSEQRLGTADVSAEEHALIVFPSPQSAVRNPRSAKNGSSGCG
jgi:hypothetical protein